MDLTIQKGTGNDILVEVTPSETQFVVIDRGIQGATGATGAAATIAVGATTTLAAGSPATVANTGTSAAAVFDFGIPQGIQGIQGIQGATGTAATIAIGTTSTIAAGLPATVTNVGTSATAIFDFGIPQGAAGTGDVTGAASSTDNAIARYDGTTGKIIQNSAVTIADDGSTVIAANSTSDGLRITQTGAGNALLVEDNANPDATPFVINNAGTIGQGTTSPTTTGFTGGMVSTSASAFAPQLVFQNTTADANGAYYILEKSRASAIVSSGDVTGAVVFRGYDGANYISAASITAAVDGTPGVNDMPGRLVFSTTADGASSPTERMRIDSTGAVGIGITTLTGYGLRVGKNITGFTSSTGVMSSGQTLSDVTVNSIYYRSNHNTQATTFTLNALSGFYAEQGTFGAGSTVTNQYGFHATSSLTGATNNYGFYGNIASSTGRFNFYANGTAANVFAGTTSIGGLVGSESLRVTPVASAVNYLEAQGQIATGGPSLIATGSDTNVPLLLKTKGAGSFNFYTSGGTLQFFVGHIASAVNYLQVVGGATGVSPIFSAQGSDTNIGFNFNAKGGGGFAFNATGTILALAPVASAVNYLQIAGGATGGGASITTQGTDANVAMFFSTRGAGQYFFSSNAATQFNIANTASSVNYLRVAGAITTAAPAISAQGSDTNIDLALTPKGTGVLRFGTYTAGILAQAGYITIKDAAGNTRNLLVG